MTSSIEDRLIEFYDHVNADVPAEGPGLNAVPMAHVTPAWGTERRSARMAVALVAAAAAILIVGLVVVTQSGPTDTVPATAPPSIVQPAVASCATDDIAAACRALGDAATANPTSTNDPSAASDPNALAAIDFNLGQPIGIPSLFGFAFANEIDPDAVIPTIGPVLGPPDHDTGWLPMPSALTCNGADEYRSILWGDLRFVLNATDTDSDGSSDLFWLAAWSVGDVSLSFSPPLDVPITGASGISDSSGLGIGSPKSAIMDHDFLQFSDQGDQVFALAAPSPVRFALVDDRVTAMSMEANDC